MPCHWRMRSFYLNQYRQHGRGESSFREDLPTQPCQCYTCFCENTVIGSEVIGAGPRTSHWLTYQTIPTLFYWFLGVRTGGNDDLRTGLPTFPTTPGFMKKVGDLINADQERNLSKGVDASS